MKDATTEFAESVGKERSMKLYDWGRGLPFPDIPAATRIVVAAQVECDDGQILVANIEIERVERPRIVWWRQWRRILAWLPGIEVVATRSSGMVGFSTREEKPE